MPTDRGERVWMLMHRLCYVCALPIPARLGVRVEPVGILGFGAGVAMCGHAEYRWHDDGRRGVRRPGAGSARISVPSAPGGRYVSGPADPRSDHDE